MALVTRPPRQAKPGPGAGVKHRARDADRLPSKLGSSRRVPRNPSTLLLPKLGPIRIRESDDARPDLSRSEACALHGLQCR